MVNGNGEPIVLNDRYEIDKRIGRGGMADVFVARDRLLDRRVAIKVLFPEFATDPNFVERFRREAQAAANLSHPNIVNVYDWGRYAGTYYIAMEYVQGRTLADILRTNGQLTATQAAEVASEVAAALSFAHKADLVHRDIKPANVLIGTNGQVKVADFGIARAMGAAAESKLTQAGAVMGTATYFSPEQAQGAQPHPRSDLYSLGIVMYEMVSGNPPFVGDNPVGIAYMQVHDAPQPLNRVVADIPRGYEAIVAKLLAKDPGRRYTTADDLRDDLRRFRTGEMPEALRAIVNAQSAAAAAAATTAAATTPAVAATATMGTVPQRQRPPGAVPVRPREAAPPSRTGWYALAAFLALIALAIGGYLLYRIITGDDTAGASTIENYAGRPLDEVTEELEQQGIVYRPVEDPSSNQPDGFVDRTDPPAGELLGKEQLLRVYFKPNPDTVLVPDVRGQTEEAATMTLADARLQVGDVDETPSEEIDEGLVVRTDPRQNRSVEEGSRVALMLSSGPEQVAVPTLVGQTEQAARASLDDVDLRIGDIAIQALPANDPSDGLVVGQSVAPGTPVDAGTRVSLTVGQAAAQTVPPATPSPATRPPQTQPPQTQPPQTRPPTTTSPPTTTTTTSPPTTTTTTSPPTTSPPTTAPPGANRGRGDEAGNNRDGDGKVDVDPPALPGG